MLLAVNIVLEEPVCMYLITSAPDTLFANYHTDAIPLEQDIQATYVHVESLFRFVEFPLSTNWCPTDESGACVVINSYAMESKYNTIRPGASEILTISGI